MAEACCGMEWLGFEDDFITKSLSKYACMRLKQPQKQFTLNLNPQDMWTSQGLQMEITYWELAGFLAMTPFLIYIAYWKGWKQGKREGYHAGRSIARAAVRNDR